MNNITKSFLRIIFLFFLLWRGIEGEAYAQIATTFMRIATAPGMNGGLSLAETNDGGFVGTGQQQDGSAGGCDVYVYKVNSCGYLQWEKLFGGVADDGGKYVQQTADGGYIVTGIYVNNPPYILLLKLDASGNLQWSKTYDVGYGLFVQQTTDGGFILSGFSAAGLGFGSHDIVLIKIDANGNTQWKKIYGGAGDEWGDYVEQTKDGGYIVTGYTTSYGAGSADLFLLKVDSLGTKQWDKTYGGTGGDGNSSWGISGQATNDGGYMLCGNTTSYGSGSNDILMIKTDNLGNPQWAKAYGGANDEQPRFAHQTSDKGFIICGYTTSFGFGDLDAYLIKTDSTGALQWSKSYGGTAYDKGEMVRETPDKGYALSMITLNFGANYYDPVFMKTDSMGVVGCNEANCATIVTNVNPTVGAGLQEMTPALVTTNTPLVTNNYSATNNFICLHCGIIPTFTYSSTSACIGNIVYFYNTTHPGNACTEWFVNGISDGVHDTLPLIFSSSGIQKIQLVASCGNNTDTNTVAINILAHDAPVAAFINNTVCNGNSTQFTDNSTSNSGTINSWTWNFGDGSPVNITPSPGYVYTNPGLYSVILSVVTTFGCTDTAMRNIVVHPLPHAQFDTVLVCKGDTVQFNNLSTIISPDIIQTLTWNFGDGSPVSHAPNPSHPFSPPGTYNVKLVAVSGFGCKDSITHAITISPSLTAHAGFGSNNLCSGGIILLGGSPTATGGVTPYTYSWTPTTGLSNHTIANPFATITANITYIVKVTDAAGCNKFDTVHVTFNPNGPHADAGFGNNTICTGGTVLLGGAPTASGGTGPYTYSWLPHTGLSNSSAANPTATITANTTYTVTVTDANGCQNIDSVQITHNSSGPFANAGFGHNTICTGGTVLLGGAPSATGGTAPYTYSWTPATGLNNPASANPTATITGNAIYILTVIDANGCQNIDSVHLTHNSSGPFADAGFGNNTVCTGGTILLGGAPTASGGTSPYNYSWLPTTGLSNPVSSNPTATITATTTYTLTIVDSAGCQNSDTVHVSYNQNGPFAAAGFGNNTICTGGTVILGGSPTGSGGTSPYTYSWTPAIGINNPASANPTATITANAVYSVTVTDAHGCQNIDSVHLTFNSSGPYADAGFGNNTVCTGGTILLGGAPTATGGVSPYTYSWQPSAGLNNSIFPNPTASVTANTFYFVIVRDANGCLNLDSVHITYNSSGPHAEAGFGNNTLCTGGNILLGGAPTVIGGSAPYTYSWLPVTNLNSPASANPIASITANSLYVLTVTDIHGCQDIDSVSVLFSATGPYADAGFGSNTVCTGGTILLGGSPTATGGIAPYTYSWTPTAGINNPASAYPTAIVTGNSTYSVTVVDATGCQNIDSVHIHHTSGPNADAGFGNNSLCTGGTIMLGGTPTAGGGTAPYIYSWLPSTGLNHTNIANPIASITTNMTYVVIVTDGAGCKDIDTVVVIHNSTGPFVNAGSGSSAFCYGQTFLLGGAPTASGGTIPYTYSWIPSAGLNNPTGSNPAAVSLTSNTIFYLTITDAAGCTNLDSAVVNIIGTGITANFIENPTTGLDPLSVQFTNQSVGAGLTYQWFFGDSDTSSIINPDHTFHNFGSDTAVFSVILVATDINGCKDTASYTAIKVDPSSAVIYPNVFTPNGDGINDVFNFNVQNLKIVSASIFNRWGEKMYVWNEPSTGWDGRTASGVLAPAGVYFFIFTAVGVEGKTYQETGTILLTR